MAVISCTFVLSPCATSEPRRRLSATFVLCDKFTSEVYLLRSSEKLKKANQVSAIAAGSAIQIKETVFHGRTTELSGLRPDRPAVYYLPTHPSPVYSCNLNLGTGSTRNLLRTDHTTGDNSNRQSLPYTSGPLLNLVNRTLTVRDHVFLHFLSIQVAERQPTDNI